MNKNKPFIFLFKTPYHFHIYDVNTNSIINIDQDVYLYLQDLINGNNPKTDNETYNKLKVLYKSGYLSINRPQIINHNYSQHLADFLEREMNTLVLQITQQCNFRCKYCIYAGSEGSTFRKHSNKRMNWEIAKKAIDFLWYHSLDAEDITINFYGGEPLLELDLIKKIVSYAKSKFLGKPLEFGMTTNGSLLEDETVDFLVDNNVALTISLDGEKDAHNTNRVFAANGYGSFDIIIHNIRRLQLRYPHYFKTLSINMVIDENIQEILFDLKNKYEGLFSDLNIRMGFVNFDHILESTKSDQQIKNWLRYEYHDFLAILEKIGRYNKKNVADISLFLLDENMYKLHEDFSLKHILTESAPSGPCIPGLHKLFVTTEGNILPCERVSELNNILVMGNINEGIDFDKADKILNVAKLSPNECRDCYAYHFCQVCARSCINKSGFSKEARLKMCGETKALLDYKLRLSVLLNDLVKIYNYSYKEIPVKE